MNVAIVTIVKNEATCLLEWLAYHRAVGIEHFVIIDNGSTDGTWELLQGLRRCGLVHCFRFNTLAGQAPQVDAYQAALVHYGRRFDVMAFLDADEYLTPTVGQASVLPDIERLFREPSVSAVALNWACFGSSGEVFMGEPLVPERFVQRADEQRPTNHQYKSLVRPSRVVRFFNPHQAWLSEGGYVDARGEPLETNHDEEKKAFGFSQQVHWHRLRINHYVVKSLEEFLVRKSRVGSAARAGKVKHRRFFESHDFNEVRDESLLAYMADTHRELGNLREALNRPSGMGRARSVWRRMVLWLERLRWWLRRWRLYGAMRLRHGPLSTRDYRKRIQDKSE